MRISIDDNMETAPASKKKKQQIELQLGLNMSHCVIRIDWRAAVRIDFGQLTLMISFVVGAA